MKVSKDVLKYLCRSNYSEYLTYEGKQTDTPPITNPYRIGDIVFETDQNTIGVVIGCITPDEVRTNSNGMRLISEVRLATYEDVMNGARIPTDPENTHEKILATLEQTRCKNCKDVLPPEEMRDENYCYSCWHALFHECEECNKVIPMETRKVALSYEEDGTNNSAEVCEECFNKLNEVEI